MSNDVIVFAFRYCLGRMTTAPSIMVEVLIRDWDEITARNKTQIQKEIREAIANDRAGMDMDVREWEKILELKI